MRTTQTKIITENTNHATLNRDKASFFSNQTVNEVPFFNPAVIQPKLIIGSPDDKFEKEADQVANLVTSLPENAISRTEISNSNSDYSGKGNFASPRLTNQLHQTKNTGLYLPNSIQNEMKNKTSIDYSRTKIHTNSKADQMNQDLGARAFAFENNIYFRNSEYRPETAEGKRLLIHELTHVAQQGGADIQRQLITPLGSGGGYRGIMDRDRRASHNPSAQNETTQHREFVFPGISRMMTPRETQFYLVVHLANPQLYATLQALIAISRVMDITIGVGVQLGGAAVIGASGSAGYVINRGRLGFYGSYGGDLGAIVSASAEIVFTVIDGGLGNFSGPAVAAVFGGGEVIVGHFSLIMPISGSGILGISLSGGAGIGLTPVEAYISITNTHAPTD